MTTSVIAVLTCHDRREKTLQCLGCYNVAALEAGISPRAVLVDDGSSDGTANEVRQHFPWVEIIPGNGSLYWNGGMRVAFGKAMEIGADYFLWLNDDTMLYENTLERLLTVAQEKNAIIVGSSLCDTSKKHSYGGVRQESKMKPLSFVDIKPSENNLIECDTFNGNCVFIPRRVVSEIGNLSAEFTHTFGDFDYGLRAKKRGVKSFVAPGYYGTCSRNQQSECFNKNKSLLIRWKFLHSPKGVPPKEWWLFSRKHASFLWPIYVFKLYWNVLFP